MVQRYKKKEELCLCSQCMEKSAAPLHQMYIPTDEWWKRALLLLCRSRVFYAFIIDISLQLHLANSTLYTLTHAYTRWACVCVCIATGKEKSWFPFRIHFFCHFLSVSPVLSCSFSSVVVFGYRNVFVFCVHIQQRRFSSGVEEKWMCEQFLNRWWRKKKPVQICGLPLVSEMRMAKGNRIKSFSFRHLRPT